MKLYKINNKILKANSVSDAISKVKLRDSLESDIISVVTSKPIELKLKKDGVVTKGNGKYTQLIFASENFPISKLTLYEANSFKLTIMQRISNKTGYKLNPKGVLANLEQTIAISVEPSWTNIHGGSIVVTIFEKGIKDSIIKDSVSDEFIKIINGFKNYKFIQAKVKESNGKQKRVQLVFKTNKPIESQKEVDKLDQELDYLIGSKFRPKKGSIVSYNSDFTNYGEGDLLVVTVTEKFS